MHVLHERPPFSSLTRSFDELYRIASISSGSLGNLSYTREPAGNITAITDNLNPSNSQSFEYDDLYRLTGATGNYGSIAYTYDAVGNRLSKNIDGQIDTYTYEPGTNRLTAIEGAAPKTFTYDPNGNTLSENERAYAYNQHNRLMSISQNGSSLAEYVYNGIGQRVKKSTQDGTRLFHYDLSGHLIAETDEEGDLVAEYVYLGDQPLAMIGERDVRNAQEEQGAASCFVSQASWAAPLQQASSKQEAIYYIHGDHLGTPQLLTDDTGSVVWKAMYKPFGEAVVEPNPTVVNNLRFPGQYFDEEMGLHYNYHRYYDPRIGRYLMPDPYRSALSFYTYCSNNPYRWCDPLGLCPIQCAGLDDVLVTKLLLDAIHYLKGTKPYWDLLGQVIDEMKSTERRFEIYRSDLSLSSEKRIQALLILSEHYDFLIETQMEIFRTIGIKTIRFQYGP